MKIKEVISWGFILLASVVIFIGRIYDERLEVLDINFSIILSGSFILFALPILFSFRSIKLTPTKRWFYSFLSVIIFSPILWAFYDVVDYGFEKYLNFLILIIPLLVILVEKFNYNDVNKLINVLIWFIITLALIGSFIVVGSNERLSVLGGGPIVFARWMIVGILILFFIKKKQKIKTNWLLMLLFLVLSLAAGSRGPVYALLITFCVYVFLNFQKSIIKIIAIIFVAFSFIMLFGLADGMLDLGKTDRLVTKDSTSKNIRLRFVKRSLEITTHYPMGVGIGNWQTYCNKLRPYHLLKHDYPHNLVLEIFSELGFLGGIIFLLLMLRVVYHTYARMVNFRNNKGSFYPLLFYLLIFLIVNSFFSGNLNDARLLFVIIAISLIDRPLINVADNE